MTAEERSALVIGLLSMLLLIPSVRFPVLESLSNPISVVVGGLLIVVCLATNNLLVAVVLIAVALYLFNERTVYVSTNQQQLYQDTTVAESNFNASTSLDLEVANKTLVRASPEMLNPPRAPPDLLAYPPSEDTLRSLSG